MRDRLGPLEAELPDGGVSAVTGPSGAGKSTLLRLCNRLVAPDAGRVTFRGADVAGLDVLAHRRRVGLVLQRPVAFPGTVLDNLRVADPALDDAGAAALLERCALDAAFLPRRADALSGGEAQRACLARTLATRPEVLLADEPTAALDPAAGGVLEGLLRGLAVQEGVPVVLVTHDAAQRARLADHELALEAR